MFSLFFILRVDVNNMLKLFICYNNDLVGYQRQGLHIASQQMLCLSDSGKNLSDIGDAIVMKINWNTVRTRQQSLILLLT